MTKNYFYIILLAFSMFSARLSAQENKPAKSQDSTIEGLSFYPNPVGSENKIYITSKLGLDKEVIIFDVLGKIVMQTALTGKELNVANLAAGVYIIRIKEGDATATRKLIVR